MATLLRSNVQNISESYSGQQNIMEVEILYRWLAEMHSIHILTLLGQKPLKSITKQTWIPAEIRNSPTGCCTSAVDKCILYHDAITLCIISWRIALFNTFPTLWTQPFRYTVLNVISIESVKILAHISWSCLRRESKTLNIEHTRNLNVA